MADISAGDRQVFHREIWDRKPVLREVYGHLYRRMAAAFGPGLTLEIGGGSGNMKTYAPDLVSCDIVSAPWVDLVADAQALPFKAGSVGNIAMFDVLHHIEFPIKFLREAERVLAPGGRLVMLDPAITFASSPFYRWLHEEPVDMSVNPLQNGVPNPGKDPYLSNQAIPTLLATRHRASLTTALPGLSIDRAEWLSLFAYPLCGGFKSWSLITAPMARLLLAFEDRVAPMVGRWCGFRLLLVMQKTP